MQLHRIFCLITVVLLDLTCISAQSIEEVESNLMSLFGFKRKPSLDKSKVVIPQAMLELYKRQTGHDLDTVSLLKPGLHTNNANTVRSFTHVESPVDAKFPGHHRFRIKFDLRTIPAGERIKAAEIILNRHVVDWFSTNAREHYQQVIVNDVIRPGVRGKHDTITRLIDSKQIDTRKNGSLSLDVLPAVQRWLENPSRNHGLIVTVQGFGKNKTTPARHLMLRRDAGEDEKVWQTRQPLLFTYTDDGKYEHATGEEIVSKRAKRATMRKRRRKDHLHEACKRHSMYVDFTHVGWNNWIVAPPGYDAFYCHGDCNFPIPEHLNTTNHAIIQTLVNSVTPSKVPRACCVPTQLNVISMLYLDDENKVVLKNYKDMTVVGCGCR